MGKDREPLCYQKKFANTLFFFREIEGNAPSDYLAEDKEHEEKISALKNRIKGMAIIENTVYFIEEELRLDH